MRRGIGLSVLALLSLACSFKAAAQQENQTQDSSSSIWLAYIGEHPISQRVEPTSRRPILLLRVGGQTRTLFSAAGIEARIFSWNFCTGYLCLLREVPCHHGRFEGTP